MNQAVTLLRYVRTSNGWRRRAVIIPTSLRGAWEKRVDTETASYGPDVVDLGEYQIRWYENSKARYESGGDRYRDAVAAMESRFNRLNLVRASEQAGVQPPPEAATTEPLIAHVQTLLQEREASKKITSGATRHHYEFAFAEFLAITKIRYAAEVTEKVITKYLATLRKRGLVDQTQLNYYLPVAAVLRHADPALGEMLSKYTPSVKRKKPACYTQDEIDNLLAYLYGHGESHKYYTLGLVAEFYYKTGLREEELTHLPWDAVDLKAGFFRVENGRQFDLNIRGKKRKVTFYTKTRTDRDIKIPIEAGLLAKLRAWRDRYPKSRFLFPTAPGNPDRNVLFKLRVAICHAGLNCGQCENCLRPCGKCKNCRCQKCRGCRQRPKRKCVHPHHGRVACSQIQCLRWRLHKFRHTFATTAVRNGADLPMVMNLLGHLNLSTTQVYVSAAQEIETQTMVNRVFQD